MMVEQHDYRVAQYVAFGFLIMTTVGHACLMPFLTLHLKHLGLSATQVALMRSAQSAIALCSTPLWIQCAFRYKKRQLVIALSLFISIVAYLMLSAIPPMTTSNYQSRCSVNTSKTATSNISEDKAETGTSNADSKIKQARLSTTIRGVVTEPRERLGGDEVSPSPSSPPIQAKNTSRPSVDVHRRRAGFKWNKWKPKNRVQPKPKYSSSSEYEDFLQEDYDDSLRNSYRVNKAGQKSVKTSKDLDYRMPLVNNELYDYQESVNFGVKNEARRTFPKNAGYQTNFISETGRLNQQDNINDYGAFAKAVPRHLAMFEDTPEMRRGSAFENVLLEDPRSVHSQNKNGDNVLRRRNVVEYDENKPYSADNPLYSEYDDNDYPILSPDYRNNKDNAYEMAGVSQQLWERQRLPRSNLRHHVLKRILNVVPNNTQQKKHLRGDKKKRKPSSSIIFPTNTTANLGIGRHILQLYADIDNEVNSPDKDQSTAEESVMQGKMGAVENNVVRPDDVNVAAGVESSNSFHTNSDGAVDFKTLIELSTKESTFATNSLFLLGSATHSSDHYAFALSLLLLIIADLFISSANVVSDDAWYEFLDDVDELQLYGKHWIPAQLLAAIAVLGTGLGVATTSCLMFNIDHFKIYFYAYAIIVGNAVVLSLCFPVVTSTFSLSSNPPKALPRLKMLFGSPTATLFAITVALGGMWTACSHDYILWAIEDLGGNEYHFAIAIAVGILSEMASPSLAKRLIRRFKLSKSLALVVCIHSARLLASAVLQTPVGLIFGQGLQFVSVATIHIIVRAYMLHIADPSLNHVMQSSLSTVVHRFGQACGSIVFGPLYDYLGIAGMFFVASITAFVWGIFLFAVHKRITVDNNELCFKWQTPYVSKMETVPSLLESESDDDWLQDAIKKDTYKLKTQAY